MSTRARSAARLLAAPAAPAAAAAVAAVAVIGALALGMSVGAPSPSAAPADAAAAATAAAPAVRTAIPLRGPVPAAMALASLVTAPDGPMTGYTRDRFGPAWADVDGNGCDTRDDILRRDLRNAEVAPDRCTVVSGALTDPYTGRVIPFLRGRATSTAVQIDHLVPLADAWRSGAAGWTPDRREAIANDPLNLAAVDGPTNEAKGDDTADTWLPPRADIRCAYVARQVAVKAKYGLTVTAAERAAMSRELGYCPAQTVDTSAAGAL